MPAVADAPANTGIPPTENLDASFASLDALLPAEQVPDLTPEPEPESAPGKQDAPPPDKTPAAKPEPAKPAPAKVVDDKTPAKPAAPAKQPEKPGTLRENYERTKSDLGKANERIKALEAQKAKPVDDTALKALQTKHEETLKRLETAETELKFVNYEKHPEFGEKYMKPMEEAYANGIESVKGFRVTDEAGERHGTDKDFDSFMAIADPEEAWRFAETRFGTKAPIMWQHRQQFVKALGAKNKAVEDYRKTGMEREKQSVAQRTESQRQIAEQWRATVKDGVEKYPNYFKEVEGDEAGNKTLAQGMAVADLAFGVLAPEMIDLLPAKIKEALVDGKLPSGELLKLHTAVRNMSGAFPRAVRENAALKTELKALKDKLAGYEESEPTGTGDGSGKPADKKKEYSWETAMEKLANGNA